MTLLKRTAERTFFPVVKERKENMIDRIHLLFKSVDVRRKMGLRYLAWAGAVGLLVVSTFKSPVVSAGSADDAFTDLLDDICMNPTTPELFELCIDAGYAGGGAGGGGGLAIITNNFGVVGALSRSANTAAAGQRTRVESRLEELRENEDQHAPTGGGASADVVFGRVGLFTSLTYTETERDETSLENGYESDLSGITLGVDYRFSDQFVAGIAAGYSDADADFDNAAGTLDTKSISVTLYGTYAPIPSAYLDAYLGYANQEYDSERNVAIMPATGVARGDTDGDQILAGVAAGYEWNSGALSIGSFANLDYIKTEIDSYKEKGGLGLAQSYDDQTTHSLTTAVGLRSSYAISFPWGVLLPQGRLSYVHEFKDDARGIPSSLILSPGSSLSLTTDDPDRDYFLGGAGASIVLARGVQLFVDLEKLFGHDFMDDWTATAGFRAEF